MLNINQIYNCFVIYIWIPDVFPYELVFILMIIPQYSSSIIKAILTHFSILDDKPCIKMVFILYNILCITLLQTIVIFF